MIVYTAGKYSDTSERKIQNNINLAREYAIKFWEANITVISPQCNSAHFERYSKKVQWHDYLIGDFEIILNVDAVFLLPNWRTSKGAMAEKAFCEKHNIFVTESYEELVKKFHEFNANKKNQKIKKMIIKEVMNYE